MLFFAQNYKCNIENVYHFSLKKYALNAMCLKYTFLAKKNTQWNACPSAYALFQSLPYI